jgi:hypothetical protein
MEARSELLEDVQRNGVVELQEAPGASEGVDLVSGGLTEREIQEMSAEELQAVVDQMHRTPSPEQIQAARQRAADRVGARTPPTPTVGRKGDEELDDLPASERWRLG